MAVSRRVVATCLVLGAANGKVETPWTDFASYNLGRWHGRAVSIDPVTAAPRYPEARFTVSHAQADRPLTYITKATLLEGGAGCEFETTLDERADVDLDGTYSNDHAGCALSAMLGAAAGAAAPADPASAFVVEHSIAADDDERVRLFLTYGAPAEPAGAAAAASGAQALLSVLLLREVRQAAEAEGAPPRQPEPRAPCTLYSLLGDWRGDACVRQPAREAPGAPEPAPRGFGQGAGRGKARGGGGSAVGFGQAALNVYKAAVSYMWDGDALVGRRLGFSSFSGEELDAILSTGALQTSEGQFGCHEAVAFARGADPTAPRMLLLPDGCFVLAPSRLAGGAGASFATEFGVLLEGGESFGMMGYVDEDEPLSAGGSEAEEPDFDAAGGDPTAPRMVRVLRLYDTDRAFVSGTTSLCSAVGASPAGAQ